MQSSGVDGCIYDMVACIYTSERRTVLGKGGNMGIESEADMTVVSFETNGGDVTGCQYAEAACEAFHDHG